MKSFFKLLFFVLVGIIALDILFDETFFVSIFAGSDLLEAIIVTPIIAIIMFMVFVILFVVLAGVFGVVFAVVCAAIIATVLGSILSMWPLFLFGLIVYWLFADSKKKDAKQY